MYSRERVAVVTGANRGIGFEVCRQLAKHGLQVVLTSRSEVKGQESIKQLQEEGLNIIYHQLDVTDPASIEQLAGYVRERYKRLDVLVNNAAIFLDSKQVPESSVFCLKDNTLQTTIETNLYGPLRLCKALIPLMIEQSYGRVINVSSSAGQLSSERHSRHPAYRISKTAQNALTLILADELKGTHVLVNAACPGWVKTDLGGPNASRTLEEGADTIVWLATLPDDGPTGGFFRDRQRIEW